MSAIKQGGSFIDWNDPNGNKLISINRDGTLDIAGLNFPDGTSQTTANGGGPASFTNTVAGLTQTVTLVGSDGAAFSLETPGFNSIYNNHDAGSFFALDPDNGGFSWFAESSITNAANPVPPLSLLLQWDAADGVLPTANGPFGDTALFSLVGNGGLTPGLSCTSGMPFFGISNDFFSYFFSVYGVGYAHSGQLAGKVGINHIPIQYPAAIAAQNQPLGALHVSNPVTVDANANTIWNAIPEVVISRGNAGQTADMLQFIKEDYTTVMLRVNKDGLLMGLPTTDPHAVGALWDDPLDSHRVKVSQG